MVDNDLVWNYGFTTMPAYGAQPQVARWLQPLPRPCVAWCQTATPGQTGLRGSGPADARRTADAAGWRGKLSAGSPLPPCAALLQQLTVCTCKLCRPRPATGGAWQGLTGLHDPGGWCGHLAVNGPVRGARGGLAHGRPGLWPATVPVACSLFRCEPGFTACMLALPMMSCMRP